MNDIELSQMELSTVTDDQLQAAFMAVANQQKDTIKSIRQTMMDAADVYAKYKNIDFVPSDVESRKDHAFLVKAEKSIGDQYASLKAAYDKPLMDIDANIQQIRQALKSAANDVDGAVKAYKEERQVERKKEIQKFFDEECKFCLLPLDRLFDNRWLNKTVSAKQAEGELCDKITKIYTDLKTLEKISDYGAMAKANYLETLDLSQALSYVDTMRENAKKLAEEKADRERREMEEADRQAQIDKNNEAWKPENREATIQSLADEALDLPEEKPVEEKPAVFQMALKFIGSIDQLKAVRAFLAEQGIEYEKMGDVSLVK
jgi:hypothetical protein